MLYVTQILPNIWWSYTDNSKPINDIDKDYLNKFCQYHKISQVIKIDKYLTFWNKSTQFIFDIKKQIEKYENDKLIMIISKIINLINSNYLKSIDTIIHSNIYNEIGLIIWICFFKKFAKLPIHIISNNINDKLNCKIILTEKEKRFMQLNNL